MKLLNLGAETRGRKIWRVPILKSGHSWSVKVAVVAHTKKKLDGGLPELRTELRRRGQTDVVWREVMEEQPGARCGPRRRHRRS